MSPIVAERLSDLDALILKSGSHESAERGMCVMEATSFIAGEPFSDTPQCACPVISSFLRSWNDGIRTDEDRTRLLKGFIPRLVGSRSTPEVELHRSYLAFDWLARVQAPAWMDLTPSLASHATALRALAPLVTADAVRGATLSLQSASKDAAAARDAARAAVRAAAWDAAWDAARAAARAAAWDAARAAAWDAAWDAARAAAWAAAWDAAWDAARAAAWDAARDAARAAAGDAAWDALRPTVTLLEISALDLVERMLAVTPESLEAK